MQEGKTSKSKRVEVTFSEPCTFAGDDLKKGDKLTVTQAQAERLKERELIN